MLGFSVKKKNRDTNKNAHMNGLGGRMSELFATRIASVTYNLWK